MSDTPIKQILTRYLQQLLLRYEAGRKLKEACLSLVHVYTHMFVRLAASLLLLATYVYVTH